MHPATDGSAALASVGRPSQDLAVYLDDALGPERAAIAVHIEAWASLVDTASAARLAVVARVDPLRDAGLRRVVAEERTRAALAASARLSRVVSH
jgi:hypothetical protein